MDLLESIVSKVDNDVKQRIQDDLVTTLNDSRYSGYIDISKSVLNFLDYFNLEYNKQEVSGSLSTYFIWLKIVDDEIDINKTDVRERLKSNFKNKDFSSNINDSVDLFSELLKTHVDDSIYSSFITDLDLLYGVVLKEKSSENMVDYLDNRKQTGELTANATHTLIKPNILGDTTQFLHFFQNLGATGSLIDSVLDMKRDLEEENYSFNPSLFDNLLLYKETIKDSTKLILKHPFLINTFSKSALNNFKSSFY